MQLRNKLQVLYLLLTRRHPGVKKALYDRQFTDTAESLLRRGKSVEWIVERFTRQLEEQVVDGESTTRH
ncbi:MAG: hypothetical protein PHQ23_15760 [Candidatus Wallbacteria bacterium]|nr:hypothetical protein [Candidatus Wallbacteria bacterium]